MTSAACAAGTGALGEADAQRASSRDARAAVDASGTEGGVADSGVPTDAAVTGNLACPGPVCLSREFANWPMPNAKNLPLPNPPLFEEEGDGVRDGVTGLLWSREYAALGDYAAAEQYCDARSGNIVWRLPTRIELVSLLDHTVHPAIDGSYFPGTPPDYFWTSSLAPDAASRYSVYFGTGETAWGLEEQPSAYARCVAEGWSVLPTRYRWEGGVVTDLATGLRWQRAALSAVLSLKAGRDYCSALDLPGRGWRIPSAKELQTLIVPPDTLPRSADALIDEQAFPDTPAQRFWGDSGDGVSPLIVDFSDGFAGVTDTGALNLVRCVR